MITYSNLQHYSNLKGIILNSVNTGAKKEERQLTTTENSCVLSQEIRFLEQRFFACKRNFAHKL